MATTATPALIDRPMSGRVSRHFAYLSMRMPDAWTTFGLALFLGVCGVMSETQGVKVMQAGYVGAILVCAVLYPHYALKANVKNGLLWLFPIWALVSAAWSTEPDLTYHDILLIMLSLIGVCFVGALPEKRAVHTGFFIIMAGYIAFSMVAGKIWLAGHGDFSGVLPVKNMFGHLCAMEVLFSLGMLGWLGTREGFLVAAAGVAGALGGCVALLASHATGSLLSLSVAAAFFASLLLFRRLSVPFRVALVAAIAGVVIFYLLFHDVIEQEIFASVLRKFGKDTTLTGRTTLWAIADRLIAKHPVIGMGYGAFWSLNNPDAWMIWRMMEVPPGRGFTFHNSFRDILVDLGAVGLVLFLVPIAFHFTYQCFKAVASGDVIDANRAALVLYFLIRLPVETVGYSSLTIDAFVVIGFQCFTVTGKSHWRTLFVRPELPMRTAAPTLQRHLEPVGRRRPLREAKAPPEFRTE